MRAVFISNSGDHNREVNKQVKLMNERVINTALSQIQTGVAQYITYANDIDTISVPNDLPKNVSLKGKRLPKNEKIGIY